MFCMNLFANRSSAGTSQAPAHGVPISANFPGLAHCYSASRLGGGLVAVTATGSLIPETISMTATTPSAPLLFVPSQHPHQPHQFVPHQGNTQITFSFGIELSAVLNYVQFSSMQLVAIHMKTFNRFVIPHHNIMNKFFFSANRSRVLSKHVSDLLKVSLVGTLCSLQL